jgi:hypothetical protein
VQIYFTISEKCSESTKGYAMKLTILIIVLGATAWLPTKGWAQVNSGSTGSDGALDFSAITNATNVVIDMHDHPTGVYNYTYINIPASVTVSFTPNANNSPVTWLVQSNCLINGTVNVSGQDAIGAIGGSGGPGGWSGGSSGNNPSPGAGPGGGGPSSCCLGGGGSYGSQAGTQGFPQGYLGSIYGNSFLLPLIGGSGGGGGSEEEIAGGGGGAGAILIASSGNIQLDGSILAVGGRGHNGWGGDASGGGIRMVAVNFTGIGAVVATGGTGGEGRIRIDAYQNTFGGSLSGVLSQGFQPIIVPLQGQGVQVSIASIGGVPVSASPTGQPVPPDATIPGQQSNPIPVIVNCANLPLNTPVTVTVKPANGSTVSAVGYNTTGTLASSTATVLMNMPRGGGIIYATATTGN